MKIILASTSAYRRALLERLKIPFSCVAPAIDESLYKDKGLTPRELALELSRVKARAVAHLHPDALVIGSDQVAALDQVIFDKPGSEEKAFEQLSLMNGRRHSLFTAVTLIANGQEESFIDITSLTMRQLSDQQLRHYIKTDQPLDCAGSYKIESLGIALFEKIETFDSTAIIGLPLLQLISVMSTLGVKAL